MGTLEWDIIVVGNGIVSTMAPEVVKEAPISLLVRYACGAEGWVLGTLEWDIIVVGNGTVPPVAPK